MNASHIPLRGIAEESRFYLIQVAPGSESDQLLDGFLCNTSSTDGVRRWNRCIAHFPYEALGILSYMAMCATHLRTWLQLQAAVFPKQESDRPDSDRPHS